MTNLRWLKNMPYDLFMKPSSNQLDLSWTAPAGMSDFVIIRKENEEITDELTDGVNYTVNTVVGDSKVVYVGTATNFTDSSLTNGKQYHYKIFAHDGTRIYQTPAPMLGIPKDQHYQRIAAGYTNNCAVDSNNKAYCWGTDNNGGLGSNNQPGSDQSAPYAVHGLMAHYKLNNDVTDSSGYGNNATVSGSPSYLTAQDSDGMDFDGVDDYVATSGLKDDLRNFTFAAWINIDSVPDPYDALSNSDHSAGGVYIDFESDGRLRLARNTFAYSTKTFDNSDVGIWHHVAITYDIEANLVNFYIDGVLDKSNTWTSNDLVDLGGSIIGAMYDGGSRYFDGKMDDVWYFSRALSASEILNLKNNFDYSDDFLSITSSPTLAVVSKPTITCFVGGGIRTVIWELEIT